MLKKILLGLLCALVGAVFLYSGYTKLYPVEPFEFTFVDMHVSSWQAAPFAARLMIGLEFLIGGLLVMNLNLRQISYKLAIGILLFFCLYLLGQIVISGNKGNCGCFGEHISMTPFQAIVKNIAMIVLLLLLNKYHEGFVLRNKLKYLLLAPMLTAIALPFILNPVELDYSEAYLNKPDENFKLELDTLYAHATLAVPPKTLSEGKHVISFLSLTCPHCRIAARKMRIMHEQDPSLPFYFVLNGKKEKLQEFYEDTGTESMPHCMLKGRPFIYLGGNVLPAIFLVNNEIVEHQLDYMTLSEKELRTWLNK